MELLYFWGGEALCLKNNIGVNMGGRFIFDYDHHNKKLNITDNKSYIPGFFRDKISNITGFVGNNGAGKTTILCGLKNIFSTAKCPYISALASGTPVPFLFACWNGKNVHVFCAFNSDELTITSDNPEIPVMKSNYFSCDEKTKTQFSSIMEEVHTIYYSGELAVNHFDKYINNEKLSDLSPVRILNDFLETYNSKKSLSINSVVDIVGTINNVYTTLFFLACDESVSFLDQMHFRPFESFALFLNEKSFSSARRSNESHSSLLSYVDKIRLICENLQLEEFDIDEFIGNLRTLGVREDEDVFIFEKSRICPEKFKEALKFVAKKYEKFPFFNSVFDLGIGAFSSGEMALLNILSRFWNIRNDVKADEKTLLIFLDEPEHYLHPQWQKQLPYILMQMCEVFFPGKIVQVIFTTNNPILLSDLPTHNVVYLEKDASQKVSVRNVDDQRTFGASVTRILADSFFLEGGMIGEFAKEKINSIIKFIELDKDDLIKNISNGEFNKVRKTIDLIGEPIIRQHLVYKLTQKLSSIGLTEDKINALLML